MTSSRSSKGEARWSVSVAHVVQPAHGPRVCQVRKVAEPAANLSQAFRKAMNAVGASVSDAARWCGVDRRTVQRWLSGDARIDVEAVLRSSRLKLHFIDALRDVALERTGT